MAEFIAENRSKPITNERFTDTGRLGQRNRYDNATCAVMELSNAILKSDPAQMGYLVPPDSSCPTSRHMYHKRLQSHVEP